MTSLAAELRDAARCLRAAQRRVEGWAKSGHTASALGTAEAAIDSTITRLEVMAKKAEAEHERA
jgi:hypothetical protein